MPPLNEGTILYMPTTLPTVSITEATRLMQIQDRILKQFPEVLTRPRQGGPSRDRHRPGADGDVRDRGAAQAGEGVAHRCRSRAGIRAGRRSGCRSGLRKLWPDVRPDHLGRTGRGNGRGAAHSRARSTPGPCPSRRASTCSPPASARRSASRSSAPTSAVISQLGEHLEAVLRDVPGTRSAYSERTTGGLYLDIIPNRARDRPLRPERRGRADAGRNRHRRHGRRPHHRRPRALHHQRPLQPRTARRPGEAQARAGAGRRRRRR